MEKKIKVEPLQNGEREEIWKNLRDIIIQRPPNYILPSYVEVSEERIMDYIMDLLSQAKKEGTFAQEELYNLKDWIDNEYIPSEDARDKIDKQIIKRVESLTNQKKDI